MARTRFTTSDGVHPGAGGGSERAPLGNGSFPEVELQAPKLRFADRADVISIDGDTVTITDYKTGEPDPQHADQLRI